MKTLIISGAVSAFLSVLASSAMANPCVGSVDHLLDAFNSGYYSQTVEIATSMIADPKAAQCASLFVIRGRAYLLLGETDAAVQDLETGVRLNPTSCMTNMFLSIGYREQGRTDISDDGLLTCIEREPRNIDARYTLTSVYFANEDFDAAAGAFASIAAISPNDVEAKIGQAFALRKASRFAEAKPYLDEILSDHPNTSYVHEEMGRWYHSQGEMQESIAWYGKSIELSVAAKEDPELIANSINWRALAWFEMGDKANARKDVDWSLKVFENASAYLTDAKLAFDEGDEVRACQSLDNSVLLGPDKQEQATIDDLLSRCR